MQFLDCHLHYGLDVRHAGAQCASLAEVKAELNRCGIAGGALWRLEADVGGAWLGNQMVSDDLAGETAPLYAVWTLLPSCTGEIPAPQDMSAAMRAGRVMGFRLNPKAGNYELLTFVLRDYFALMAERSIPLFYDTANGGASLSALYHEILEPFPNMTVVLSDANVWPNDRRLRPFLSEYKNVYLDLTMCLTAGGIEEMVRLYGSERLLYGSGFPACYPGATQYLVYSADIPAEDRARIAGKNFLRLAGGVRL